MKPAPPDTAEMLHRVRLQLILAQVRIMELEDERDEAKTRSEEIESLLVTAQKMADQRLEEAGHLEKVRVELQAQYEHMRHMQHVTNEALNQARVQAEATEKRRYQLQQDAVGLREQIAQLSENLSRLRREKEEVQNLSQGQANHVTQLQTELDAMRATRSWRWTAWFRAPGRKPDADKS